MKFEELNLHNETLQALHNNDQHEANSYQKAVLDAVKNERNLIVKTGENGEEHSAFAVAAIETTNQLKSDTGTQVLVLSDSANNLERIKGRISALQPEADCAFIQSGIDEGSQINEIGEGHAIVVANPDRLHSIIKKNRYIFRHLELLVLDGFDSMFSSREDALSSIKKRILSNPVSLISTGVFEGKVKKAALNVGKNAEVRGFGPPPPPDIPGHLKQGYINVPPRMKITTLLAHLKNSKNGNCIIFTDSKRGTDRLYRILKKQRMKAVSLHHKLSDERRAQRFANFANGNVQYLLISDISASELDINGVTQVINYDVPASADEYRYRSGLAANGGSTQIVSLVSKQDRSDINKLQNELGQTPDEIPLPEKVKQKLKERKQEKRSNGQNRKGKSKRQKQPDDLELPQPTYDQLSGGRSGSHNEKETGIVKFFKRLFS